MFEVSIRMPNPVKMLTERQLRALQECFLGGHDPVPRTNLQGWKMKVCRRCTRVLELPKDTGTHKHV